jgi:hypothetical protein
MFHLNKRSTFSRYKALGFGGLFLLIFFVIPISLWATHEIDHRFKVYGTIKDQQGNPLVDGKVIVVAKRNGAGSTVFTNKDGYYDVIIHLHNEDVGDTVEVSAVGQKKEVIVSFDPSDRTTERRVQIDFDASVPEKKTEIPVWLYAIAVILVIGVVYLF